MGRITVVATVAMLLGVAGIVVAWVTVTPHLAGRYSGGLVWATVAVALAILLGLTQLWWLWRMVLPPMRQIGAAIRASDSGQGPSQPVVAAPADAWQLAATATAQAEVARQARDVVADQEQMRQAGRWAILRIREYLRAEDLLRETRLAIRNELGADDAELYLIQDGEISQPEAAGSSSGLPVRAPPGAHQLMEDLVHRKRSLVLPDIQGPDGDRLPPGLREPLRSAGMVSALLTPFGGDGEASGVIVASRAGRDHPWTPTEVLLIELLAAHLAQALGQARVHEREEDLVAELRTLGKMKSDLLATVSHELRTPLTSIAGFVELLEEEDSGPLTPAQREMVQTVRRNATRLRRLIEDLLTLSKIESGAFKTARLPVDLTEVVGSAVAVLQPQATDAGVTMIATPGPARVLVSGDAGQLERVVLNLVSNALKFTPRGGQVSIGLSTGQQSAVLRVTDTGIGIPEAEQEGLSSGLFRASNAVARSIPGSGLGLAIVRSIVANHGGQLELSSQENEGTTVTVRIPLLTSVDSSVVPPADPWDVAAHNRRPGRHS